LGGRAVGALDLRQEASYRCDPALVAEQVLPATESLRLSIRHVISQELLTKDVVFPTLEEFWDRRWAWCVNGSHSKSNERQYGLHSPTAFPGIDQHYRRMASEALEHEVISSWDGSTSVSSSEKLEHGKTRAIFACDTRSYFAFEHLFTPISKVWRNDRVLLDPGKGGHNGIVRRVQWMQRKGGVNLMLDFDDFNSHHSTRSMQIVVEELCQLTGYPEDLASTLIASFDKMTMTYQGVPIGHVEGTLMSGHRGTSILNTILNAAYIRESVGPAMFDANPSLHAGDDVYASCSTLAEAASYIELCADYGCRMNPTKQSLGTVGAEFLRIAIGKHAAFGYFARAVSSFVSGNWSNLNPLQPDEALVNMISSCRSLINRSGWKGFGNFLAPAVRYRTGVKTKILAQLLDGRAVIEGSPCFSPHGIINPYTIVKAPPSELANSLNPAWPKHATTAYLTKHASPLERHAIIQSSTNVRAAMLVSSYSRGLTGAFDTSLDSVALRRGKPRAPHGLATVNEIVAAEQKTGVLEGYPLIRLIVAHLSPELLRELVAMAGGNPNRPDIQAEAFGSTTRSSYINGTLSFADAASLTGRTSRGTIYVNFPVFM